MSKKFGLLTLAASTALAFVSMGVQAADKPADNLQPVPKLSEQEMKDGQQIYFDRCSGCHGALRKGATGPDITPAKTRLKTVDALEKILFNGTDGGMPGWGKDGFLTKDQTTLMAKYVQNDPPQPPEWGMKEMKATWKVHVPVAQRPKEPPAGKNWQNYFGVVMRDAGKVAIIDGDTKEILTIIPSGFAVHILRTSASGRYMFAIGRDGKATMMDMWASPPNLVAEVRTGIDARSIDTSKYKGFEDKYAVVGNYWPPHYVIMDGDTLEPLKVMSTRGYTYDTNEYHPEPRVASIVASHHAPEWVLNLKETGIVLLVDYSKLSVGTVTETKINAERFLHDGGWDSTKRYFLVAANARDTISVIDTVDRKLVKNIKVGTKPHPGRGANWIDPKFGAVWGTVHLGTGLVSVISTDPTKDYAWTSVREWDLGGNSLFIKTHPNSKRVYCDNTINPKKDKVLTVFDIDKPDAKPTELTFEKKVVHMEYNKDGTELWISLWDKNGEVVVLDDKTLKEVKRIKGLDSPTGKFNVYNTMKDVY
ncbi:MAG: nitrite reductase [Magnetococcales bacterium]|nr:c-type cytochrome [Magnetococcales bacterium]NGZ25305.1 nitrite reductase [Magnetococcales bacterium]